jgi:hypothetical protein
MRDKQMQLEVGIGSTALFGMLARFYRTVGGWKTYIVRGWYLDANGCPKTYGDGYEESSTDETEYLPNDKDEPQVGARRAAK